MTPERSCATCGYHLPVGVPHPAFPKTKHTYGVPTCLNKHVANAHGILAISMARADDGRCGPEGSLWVQRRKPNGR